MSDYFYIFGKKSGYDDCCIDYFKIRVDNLNLPIYNQKNSRHILCKKCSTKPLKKYYTCFKCGWVQYGIKKCQICFVKDENSKYIIKIRKKFNLHGWTVKTIIELIINTSPIKTWLENNIDKLNKE